MPTIPRAQASIGTVTVQAPEAPRPQPDLDEPLFPTLVISDDDDEARPQVQRRSEAG